MDRIAGSEPTPLKLQSPGRPGDEKVAGVGALLADSWVRFGGRAVESDSLPWLGRSIRERWFEGRELLAARGLLDDFSQLDGPMCSSRKVDSRVVDFFERTSLYRLDLSVEWCGVFRPMDALLAGLLGERLERISYSLCAPPGAGVCFRLIYPFSHGYVNVILRPESQLDGSLAFTSRGETFGGPGIYWVVQRAKGGEWVRRVGSLRESTHVYVDSTGTVRADHELRLWGRACLKLYCRFEPEPEAA